MSRRRFIAWARRDQEDLVRDVAGAADLELAAVAPSGRGGTELSRVLGVDHVPDLREALHHPLADVLLLAAPDPIEADLRRLIRQSRARTFSLEPRPGSIAALRKDPEEVRTARFVPLLRDSAGFDHARQLLGGLAPPHALSLASRGRPEHGSLFARLMDVMDLVDHLCGDVETISATLADPVRAATTARDAAPDTLADLRGHMTINFRFAENRCATALVSSVADARFREAQLLSVDGCLRLTDVECEWTAANETESGAARTAAAPPATTGRLVGEAMKRVLDDRDRDDPPPNVPRLLALCEAARLSCRTGQSESPSRMLAMLSHV